MNNDVTTMMEKYGLEKDMPLMTAWLDQTHGSNHMPWGEYLLFWSQAKEQFLTKLFGNELIHKFDVNFCKSTSELANAMIYNQDFQIKKSAFHEALRNLLTSFLSKRLSDYEITESGVVTLVDCMMYGNWQRFSNWLPETVDYNELDFYRDIFVVVYGINNYAVRYENLANNECGENRSFRIPEARKPFQIVENQKPFKMMTSFAKYMKPYIGEKEFNDMMEAIEDFRIVHSQVLNTKNTRGKLCLSIHPMDYMTMSDNGCDWHSCMRWDDEDGIGEYHAGTLEMMTSSSVVVAYLESKDEWFPVSGEKAWSNKKWRELFIVTPDFVSGIKGYPYCSNSLEDAVLSELGKMLAENCGVILDPSTKQRRDNGLQTEDGYQLTFQTTIMYNDCEWNTITSIQAKGFSLEQNENFFYGEGAYCVKCGKIRVRSDGDIEGREDDFYCQDCSTRRICSHCGDVIRNDDYCIDPDGNIICYSCSENISEDTITGKWGYSEEFESVTIRFVDRGGYQDSIYITVKDSTTFQDLRDSGAVERIAEYRDYRYEVTAPIQEDDAKYDYLKKYFSKFEKEYGKICYPQPAGDSAEVEKKEPAYSF